MKNEMIKEYDVSACLVRKTSTGVDDGLDVRIALVLPFQKGIQEGDVTLAPADFAPHRYRAYGATADTWIAGSLLRTLRECYPDFDDLREACRVIEEVAEREIKRDAQQR